MAIGQSTDYAPESRGFTGEALPSPAEGAAWKAKVAGWALVGAALSGYKLLFFGFIYLSVNLLPSLISGDAAHQNYMRRQFRAPQDASAPAAVETGDAWSIFRTWDAQHYLHLSRNGYEAGTMSAAFYPLWPWTIRAGSVLTGGSHLAAGLILSNVFSLLACVMLFSWVLESHGRRTAETTMLLLLAFPGALFFGFVYSESIFFLLVMIFFWGLRRDRLALMGAAAFLLPLARPLGLFIALPMAVHFFLDARKAGRLWTPKYLWVGAPAAGWAAYFIFMFLATGNAFEGFAAQERFIADVSTANLFDVVGFVKRLFYPAVFHGYLDSAVDRVLFLFFVLALALMWRRDKVLFAYSLPMGLVPAMTTVFMSFTRYALVIFPVFIVFGTLLSRREARVPLWLILAGSFSLQLIFVLMHITFNWVG